jgi:hypothetical protein
MKKKQYHTIALFTGYVESNSVTSLIMTSTNKKFDSQKDAVTSLASELYEKHKVDSGALDDGALSDLACCAKHIEAGAAFCSTCGYRLYQKKFDDFSFSNFVGSLIGRDNDSWGANAIYSDDYSTEDGVQWDYIEGLSKALDDPDGVITIREYGERVMCQALDPMITGYDDKQRSTFLSGEFESFKFNLND